MGYENTTYIPTDICPDEFYVHDFNDKKPLKNVEVILKNDIRHKVIPMHVTNENIPNHKYDIKKIIKLIKDGYNVQSLLLDNHTIFASVIENNKQDVGALFAVCDKHATNVLDYIITDNNVS